MLQRRLAREFDLGRRRAAQATVDLVAVWMGRRQGLRNEAFLEQDADARMILGLRDHLAGTHQEQAGIAGMRPVGDVVLNDAGDAGGARGVVQAVAFGVIENRVMGVGHAPLQKAEGVVQGRSGFALEAVGQRLDGNLRGDLAVVVAAHAVGNDHQQGFAGVTVTGSIFVVGAPSLAAFLVDRESHRLAFLYLSTNRLSQLGPSFGVGGVTVSTSAFCSAKTLCGR